MKVFYFGCWNGLGHYLYGGPVSKTSYEVDRVVCYYGGQAHIHIDGTLAPRIRDGEVFWTGLEKDRGKRVCLDSRTSECPQGQYLVHHLDNGFTAMAWWDRCQGDTRGACNSVLLAEGLHDEFVMLEALSEYFPHVLVNLTKAGIVLRKAS